MNARPDHKSIAALPEAVRLHLESAARAIRAASRALDAAAWDSPVVARALDGIKGVEFIEAALAAQIEAIANA